MQMFRLPSLCHAASCCQETHPHLKAQTGDVRAEVEHAEGSAEGLAFFEDKVLFL